MESSYFQQFSFSFRKASDCITPPDRGVMQTKIIIKEQPVNVFPESGNRTEKSVFFQKLPEKIQKDLTAHPCLCQSILIWNGRLENSSQSQGIYTVGSGLNMRLACRHNIFLEDIRKLYNYWL